MHAKSKDNRSLPERIFLCVFYPAVAGFYILYKYPNWILGNDGNFAVLHFLGKRPGFWYATVYTALVSGTCFRVLMANRNRYQRSRKKEPLSSYQRWKFISILLSQTIAFYLLPRSRFCTIREH